MRTRISVLFGLITATVLASAPAAAQEEAEFQAAMQKLGCGAEFDRAMASPIDPTIAPYSSLNRRRLTNVLPGPFEKSFWSGGAPAPTPEQVLPALLLAPLNSLDGLSPERVLQEFHNRRYEAAMQGDSKATVLERNVANTMLCALEKMYGISLKEKIPDKLGAAVRELGCTKTLEAAMDNYVPGSALHETVSRSLYSGLDRKTKQLLLDGYDSWYAASIPAPDHWTKAADQWMQSFGTLADAYASKPTRLVPTDDEKASFSNAVLKGEMTQALAKFWLCVRGSQDKLIAWKRADNERVILTGIGRYDIGLSKEGSEYEVERYDPAILLIHQLVFDEQNSPQVGIVFGCVNERQVARDSGPNANKGHSGGQEFPPCFSAISEQEVEGTKYKMKTPNPNTDAACYETSIAITKMLWNGSAVLAGYLIPNENEQRYATDSGSWPMMACGPFY